MKIKESVYQKFAAMKWPYASQDPVAFAEIARRVAETGKRGTGFLRYRDLVQGIEFNISSVGEGKPFRLGAPEWTDLHRAILGDFLGYLCMHTYQAGGFMGSAIVVSSGSDEPSEGYRELMRQVGVLSGKSEMEFLEHWAAETTKAFTWYAQNSG